MHDSQGHTFFHTNSERMNVMFIADKTISILTIYFWRTFFTIFLLFRFEFKLLLYENHFFISKFWQWTIFGSLLDLLARELHKHFFLASLSMRPPIPLGRTFLTIHKYSHGKQNILHGITQNLYKNNTQNLVNWEIFFKTNKKVVDFRWYEAHKTKNCMWTYACMYIDEK